MTRSEGVMWLKVWREIYIPQAMKKYRLLEPKMNGRLDFGPRCIDHITSGVEYTWLNGLVDELIERIDDGEWDPVTEVAMYFEEMDAILATSGPKQFVVHRFAGFMAENAHDILWFLMKKEKGIMGRNPLARREVLRLQIQEELDRKGILCSADSFLGKE